MGQRTDSMIYRDIVLSTHMLHAVYKVALCLDCCMSLTSVTFLRLMMLSLARCTSEYLSNTSSGPLHLPPFRCSISAHTTFSEPLHRSFLLVYVMPPTLGSPLSLRRTLSSTYSLDICLRNTRLPQACLYPSFRCTLFVAPPSLSLSRSLFPFFYLHALSRPHPPRLLILVFGWTDLTYNPPCASTSNIHLLFSASASVHRQSHQNNKAKYIRNEAVP